ncbi:MAG TPA: SDR family oxidoreductase [Candidatus Methylomirabilis sp.]|nr:SDR family oxidoreductase [Candidatus Methylomirabilis sp.]
MQAYSHVTSPVLVLGATGLIGREVVRQLLAAGRPMLAMARTRDGRSATDRVIRAVGPAEAAAGPLEVVEGDLALPACGLSEMECRRLQGSVETVIHCAGETAFFPGAMTPFRAAHLGGPRWLLETLRGGRLRTWAHVSTAYVCGCRSGVVLEREAEVGQRFHNPYERVKLEAEQVMREAGARLGVDVRIFRPSLVVGMPSGTLGGSASALFFDFIRLLAMLARNDRGSKVCLRIEGAPRAAFNIVPVEYVAAALAALADHPEGAGETFHLVVSNPPTQESVLATITDRLGLHGVRVVDAREGPLASPTGLERKVARLLVGYRDYLVQDVRFDDTSARRLLDACGLPVPRLSPAVLHELIDQALQGDGGGPAHGGDRTKGDPVGAGLACMIPGSIRTDGRG